VTVDNLSSLDPFVEMAGVPRPTPLPLWLRAWSDAALAERSDISFAIYKTSAYIYHYGGIAYFSSRLRS